MSLLRNIPEACKPNPRENYENHRYLRKSNNGNERTLMSMYWDEYIGRYGTSVEYYTYNYSITSPNGHDYLYGEQPTASFAVPKTAVMLADLQSESMLLSKFGIDTNADLVLVISMAEYTRIFGEDEEPKSGDVIRLTELGWDVNEVPGYGSVVRETSADIHEELCRFKDPDVAASIVFPSTADSAGNPISGCEVWVRSPQLYEITERRHQDFQFNTNALMGHYVWVIKAKRFDYSYQPGIPRECKQRDVTDETFTGIISGGTQDPSDPKMYDGNVEDDSNLIWDYENPDQSRDDSVYGDY